MDLETQLTTHFSRLEATVVAELQADPGTLFAHELKTDAIRVDEQKIWMNYGTHADRAADREQEIHLSKERVQQ